MATEQLVLISILIFIVAVSMTMVGKGGGNFYVIILIFFGISVYQSAAIGQFILFAASSTAMLVFGKDKAVNWNLASIIGVIVIVSAFLGGFLSAFFDEMTLKVIFAILLVISGLVMVIPYSERTTEFTSTNIGMIRMTTLDGEILVNLRIVIPVTFLTSFFSGMIGVSGGSFLVPMLVLACGMPMKSSVTTVTPLIALSALMGLFGHFLQGHFDPFIGIPLAIVTIIGGYLGGRFAMKSRPKNLKLLFAVSNVLAALFIIVNIIITNGWI